MIDVVARAEVVVVNVNVGDCCGYLLATSIREWHAPAM